MSNKPSPKGNSSRLRAGRVSEPFGCYAITKVVHGRGRYLSSGAAAQCVIECLDHLRETDRIKLYAFCVMPDHLHFAICVMPGEELSSAVASFSKFTSRKIKVLIGKHDGPFWQEGFHDRHCRDRDELADLCEYIEHNPVRAGLVELAEDWSYSSAHPNNRAMLDREWWP